MYNDTNMNEKETYISPSMEIITFEHEDVIVTSTGDGNSDEIGGHSPDGSN